MGSVPPTSYPPSTGASTGKFNSYAPVSGSADWDFTVTIGPPLNVCRAVSNALSVALGGSSNAVPLMNPGVEFGNITGAALVLISVTLALSATGTAAMTAVAWPSAVITTS